MRVILHNLSRVGPQKSWVSMGLPPSFSKKDEVGHFISDDGRKFRARIKDQELFIEATLRSMEIMRGTFRPADEDIEFRFSNWVIDELEKILPHFSVNKSGTIHQSAPMVYWDGVSQPSPAWFFRPESFNGIRSRWHFRTQILDPCFITIEGWIDIFSDQDMLPLEIRCSYGTTTDALNKLFEDFGTLSMFTGEAVKIDYDKRKGLKPRLWRTDKLKWETELVSPRQWKRASVIELTGAMLCLPPYDQLARVLSTVSGSLDRWNTLLARDDAPIYGMPIFVWDTEYLSFSHIPEEPSNVSVDRLFDEMIERFDTHSDEYEARRWGQNPIPGTTGSQVDFGASKGELCTTFRTAWGLRDYRYSVQAWMLRPYHNKERYGEPVKAVNHPNTKTAGLRPDERFSRADMLGWPDPVPYFEWYATSDAQHRSDNLLAAMYAFTRSPSIKATIEDMIEMMKLDIESNLPDQSVGAPRGWGRPMLAACHFLTLGFTDVKPIIDKNVDYLYRNASMMKLPPGTHRTVRVLSDTGSKYGWLDLNGNPIRAWVCWEETIAVMGLWAAWLTTGNPRARYLAIEVAKTVTKHAFFYQNASWHACYAVRWRTDDPGVPLPNSSYVLMFPDGTNKDIFHYPMQDWMLPALRILERELPASDPIKVRATQIIDFFGRQPRDLAQSGWWAV